MAASEGDIEMVDMSSASKGREETKTAADESLELDGIGLDAEAVETASDLAIVEAALASLENPENPGVGAKQLQAAMKVAMNVAAKVLDSNDAIKSEPEKTLEAAFAYALKDRNNDEQSRQFLINYLEWCREQLNMQQQNALHAAAAPAPAPSSTSALSAAGFTINQLLDAAKALLLSKEEQAKNAIVITTAEGKSLQALLGDAERLKKLGVKYTQGEDGSGILTRSSEDSSASPYSAHFTSDGNGGFKVAITGSNPQEGLKDVLGVFKNAGVTAVSISGGATKDDAKAYQALKTALGVEGITAVLKDEGVYGSVKLFAEESATANPTDPAASEAGTKAYLEAVVGNDILRPQLIDGMVENQGANKAALEAMTREQLVKTCLDAVMPKPALEVQPAEVETQARETLASEPVPAETKSEAQGIHISNDGRSVVMNGVQGKSVTTSPAGSTIADVPPSAKRTPRMDGMVRASAHRAEAAEDMSRNGNTSITRVGSQDIEVYHDVDAGTITVNGQAMPGHYPREGGLTTSGTEDGKGLMVNGQHVEVTQSGLKVNGEAVSTRRSPGGIPNPGEIPTLARK